MTPHVAVVGAGPLGLMSIKNLKEDGFEVTAFDKRAYLGGMWKAAADGGITVAPTTVFNSSRFRSAVSDFPFPNDTDDFPTAEQLWQYFRLYAEHFDLCKHVKLNAEIKGVDRENDRWALKISYSGSDQLAVEYFDKILVATGSFVTPKAPRLEAIEIFKGKAMHSIKLDWSRMSEFDGQNVLLIGMHATAQDVTCELSGHAKKVYLSHRNGVVLVPRYGPDNRTSDQSMSLNDLYSMAFASTWFPNHLNRVIDSVMDRVSRAAFPTAKEEWNLLPAPSIATTPPLVADALWPHLESRFAEPCKDVRRITGPKTIELSDGRELDDIDTIIYCTGYHFAIPFLPPEYNPYPKVGDTAYLYRNAFSMHSDPAVRKSLAFLGHGAVPFPGFTNFELQAMAVSQTWLHSDLPPLSTMKKWHTKFQKWRKGLLAKQKQESTFHVALMPLGENLQWLDKTAGTGLFDNFGWFKWRAWRLWWQDRELYNKCLTGLHSPAMWRLFDMGRRKPWSEARKQLFIDNETADKACKERTRRKIREAEQHKTK